MSRQNGLDVMQVVEEIWNSLVLLQSIFSPVRNHTNMQYDQLQIDDTYSSLRRLFSRYREYQALQEQINFQTSSPERYKQERLDLYFNALLSYWQQCRKSSSMLKSTTDLLRDTRETLRSIIQQHTGALNTRSEPGSFKYQNTLPKSSPMYKSPVSSKLRLHNNTDKQVSEARQKTEPAQQQNLSKSDLREKELLLKKSQHTIQVLQEENQNMMRMNSQFKIDLQSLHEENNKKTIKVQMMEMQLDVIKRKSQKEQEKEFRSHSYHIQQSNDQSPYRNQVVEDEVFQLRQEKKELLNEINLINKKGKSDAELRALVQQQTTEIQDLTHKLTQEKKLKTSNVCTLIEADRKMQHQVSNLEVEVESQRDQIAFLEEQISQLKGENQSLKDFVQDQLTKNKNFMLQINELQHENELLKVQSNRKPDDKKVQDQFKVEVGQFKQEIKMLVQENQQILDENERLSLKISELYLELNQKNNNDDLQKIRQLQTQSQVLQEQVHKSNEDRKRLNQQIEMLKKEIIERDSMIHVMQKQKHLQQQEQEQEVDNDEEFQESAIKVKLDSSRRFLPELGVGSHFNCVVHVLESLSRFGPIIAQNVAQDDSCQILQRMFDHIRQNQDTDVQLLKDDAALLQELFYIELQPDNRANDFFFQIIDSLSKVIFKVGNEEMSALVKIIQQKDSPIYDNFFFLQRSLPLSEKIQFNEVPLINSIKHVRYVEPQANECDNLAQYINQLIIFEGQENNGSSFNFVVFPHILILNVYELSQAKINMNINQYIDSSALSNDNEGGKYLNINPIVEVFKYKLQSMIHCSQGLSPDRNDPLYYLTMNTSDGWVQVLYDQFEQIDKIDQILTFRKNQGDKELLIYEKMLV